MWSIRSSDDSDWRKRRDEAYANVPEPTWNLPVPPAPPLIVIPVQQVPLVPDVPLALALPPPGVVLGHDKQTDEPLYIDGPDLVGGLAILGKNGTGKSVTIEMLAVQDMEAGRGIIVLDPHGDLTARLLLRVPGYREHDVVLLDAGDPEYAFGLNPVWCPDPSDDDDVSRRGDRLLEVMRKVWAGSWGAVLDDLIPNAAYTLLYNAPDYSLLEFFRLFTSAEFRAPLVSNVTNAAVVEFWEEEYDLKKESSQATLTASAFRRMRKFVRNPTMRAILGQGRPTVDFDRFMAERKIVLVKLPSGLLEEEYVSLLGTLVVREIMTAAFNRLTAIPNIADRHPIMLYADEFERFATPDFGRMFREARKTGVIPVIAHQDMAQLDPKMRAIPRAARHLMTFQVSGEDAAATVGEYDITPPDWERTPIPNAYDRLLTRGHPNAEVVVLARHIEQEVNRTLRHIAGYMVQSGEVRHIREQLHSIFNTFFFRCMATPSNAGFWEALEELSLDGNDLLGSYLGAERRVALLKEVGCLGMRLMKAPLYATGEMFDGKSRADMREELRAALVNQPKLQMLVKLESGGQVSQRHVQVALPPDISDDAEKSARLTAYSREHYYRRKVDVEQEVAARRLPQDSAVLDEVYVRLLEDAALPPTLLSTLQRPAPTGAYRPSRKRMLSGLPDLSV